MGNHQGFATLDAIHASRGEDVPRRQPQQRPPPREAEAEQAELDAAPAGGRAGWRAEKRDKEFGLLVGWTLVGINGRPVRDKDQAKEYFSRKAAPGATITLRAQRGRAALGAANKDLDADKLQCNDWREAGCAFGARCNFRHDPESRGIEGHNWAGKRARGRDGELRTGSADGLARYVVTGARAAADHAGGSADPTDPFSAGARKPAAADPFGGGRKTQAPQQGPDPFGGCGQTDPFGGGPSMLGPQEAEARVPKSDHTSNPFIPAPTCRLI
eukprot:gene43834-14508_t